MLRDPDGYNNGGTTMWESGWLPAIYQGTEIQSRGAAVLDLHPAGHRWPKASSATTSMRWRGSTKSGASSTRASRSWTARIRNYELAARMQLSAEAVLDIGQRDRRRRGGSTGWTIPSPPISARRCLMARRLVESGVRFVQVMVPVKSGGMPWDHHEKIKPGLEAICPQVDRPPRP